MEAIRLLEQGCSVVRISVVEEEAREHSERSRGDVVVADQTRAAKIVLVECAGAFPVAKSLVAPCEAARGFHFLVLVTEALEESNTLVEAAACGVPIGAALRETEPQ